MSKDCFGGDDRFAGIRKITDQPHAKPRRNFQEAATSSMRKSVEERVAKTLETQEPDGRGIDARVSNICERVDGLTAKQWGEEIKHLCREEESDDSRLLGFVVEVAAQSLLNKFGDQNMTKRKIMMTLFIIELSDDPKVRKMLTDRIEELESEALETALNNERNKIEQVGAVGSGMREGVRNAFNEFGVGEESPVLIPARRKELKQRGGSQLN